MEVWEKLPSLVISIIITNKKKVGLITLKEEGFPPFLSLSLTFMFEKNVASKMREEGVCIYRGREGGWLTIG